MSKRNKLKNIAEKSAINKQLIEYKCHQREDDILLEFGHITNQKEHCYDALLKVNQTDTTAIRNLMNIIIVVSKSTWTELSHRNKNNMGGYESLDIDIFKTNILDNYPEKLSNDIKLYSFRFGSSDKYRMIGYKSKHCKRVLHILGFDLDFSLYKHE